MTANGYWTKKLPGNWKNDEPRHDRRHGSRGLGYARLGKTGTAQAGSVDGEVNNCWFTGYCRIGDKTYVITVMAEDGTSGAGTAMPVFGDIAGFLKRSRDAIS